MPTRSCVIWLFRFLYGLILVSILAVALAFLFPGGVYDFVILHITTAWYREVLDRVARGSRILDVGIGTGTALAKNAELVQSKQLRFVGLDYDCAYLERARVVLDGAGLSGGGVGDVKGLPLLCKSVYDDPKDIWDAIPTARERFDAVYFSGSFSLLPDPVGALQMVARNYVKKSWQARSGKGESGDKGGRIFITQVFQSSPSPVMEVVKPLLKYLTRIDFGRAVPQEELASMLEQFLGANPEWHVARNNVISTYGGTPWQKPRLIILSNSKTSTFDAPKRNTAAHGQRDDL